MPQGQHESLLPRFCLFGLPRVHQGLVDARRAVQQQLEKGRASGGVSPGALASLDSRQRALKLCSNALYGFTGSNASPQQCIAVADACLG